MLKALVWQVFSCWYNVKTSLDDKVAKLDKKLKWLSYNLKAKQDPNGPTDDIVNGEGYVITDRNIILL